MSPAARALRPYIQRQWKALAGAGGATGVLTAADLAKPWPLALVVDQLLVRQAPFSLDGDDWRLLAGIAVLVLLIALAEAGALYLSNLWLQTAGERISHELRIAVYDHLQRLSLAFHQKRPKGDLVTRVTGDVNAMGDLFAQQLGAIAQALLLSLGMTVVLLVLDPVLALVSLATTPALLGISWIYRGRVRSTARVRRRHEGEIASTANEALSAMAVVKAFGGEQLEAERVRAGSERRMAVGVDIARLQAGFDGLVGAVRAIGTALVIVVGVMRVAAGALSPGELLVFVSYTRKAYNPLKSLARESTKVAATMAKADRIAEILAADDVLEERPGAYRGGRADGDVALEGVSFAYDRERPVLHDVSMKVGAGECVALVGPSGAGKSTLGALVARFHDPSKGRVLIDGRDARDCALEWLRAQVAILLQDTVLFTGTVRENIAYGSQASDEEIVAAAKAAVAHEFIRELPEGYETELGPQGIGLSGGQRQRIGIARTLLRDPPILLLDEPTTALDAAAEAQLLDGLRTLVRGRTTILISHSPRLTRLADRVVRLEHGNRWRDPCEFASRTSRPCESAHGRCRWTRPCPSSSGCSTRTRWRRCSPGRSTRHSTRRRSAASSTSPASSSPSTTTRGWRAPSTTRWPPASPASTSPSARGSRATPTARGGSTAARPRGTPSRTTTRSARSSPGCPSTRGCPRSASRATSWRAGWARTRPASSSSSATSREAAPSSASAGSC